MGVRYTQLYRCYCLLKSKIGQDVSREELEEQGAFHVSSYSLMERYGAKVELVVEFRGAVPPDTPNRFLYGERPVSPQKYRIVGVRLVEDVKTPVPQGFQDLERADGVL